MSILQAGSDLHRAPTNLNNHRWFNPTQTLGFMQSFILPLQRLRQLLSRQSFLRDSQPLEQRATVAARATILSAPLSENRSPQGQGLQFHVCTTQHGNHK